MKPQGAFGNLPISPKSEMDLIEYDAIEVVKPALEQALVATVELHHEHLLLVGFCEAVLECFERPQKA